MEPLPFLLDAAALEDAGPLRLKKEAMECFGQNPVIQWPSEEQIENALCALRHDAEQEWWRSFGLEFLWGHWVEHGGHHECPSQLRDIRPFEGSEITLAELWDAKGATVLIPIRTSSGDGAILQMWLIRMLPENEAHKARLFEPDHRKLIDGLASWIDRKDGRSLRVFLRFLEPDLKDRGVVGASWMLGAALAMRALESDDGDALRLLGSDWIITGELDVSERVGPVGMAGKTNLLVPRGWIAPAANEPDLPPRFRTRYAGRIGLVVDLETAWRHLSGAGTQRELPSEQWPCGDQVEALHGLVSPAVRPLIASLLYTKPRKLFLWHSTETAKQAVLIQGVAELLRMRDLLPTDFEATPLLMDAADLVKAEEDIRNQSTISRAGERPILFNITGGNMLMKYAAINLAVLNRGVWLLYRDASNSSNHDFVRLRTSGTQFAISPLRGDETAGIDWDFLFGFSRDDTVESIVNGIFSPEA